MIPSYSPPPLSSPVAGPWEADITSPNPPAASLTPAFKAQVTAKGVSPLAAGLPRAVGHYVNVVDAAAVANKVVSGAANNGGGLIRITTSAAHGYATNDQIGIYGVLGTTEANGWWKVTVIDATHFDLQGSAFVHAFTGAGTATNRPMISGMAILIAPAVDRGGLTGTAQHGDDVAGVTVHNYGAGKATDAFYVAVSEIPAVGWATSFNSDTNCDYVFRFGAATAIIGVDLRAGTFTGAAILIPNNSPLSALKADGVTLQPLLYLDNTNVLTHDLTTQIRAAGGTTVRFGAYSADAVGPQAFFRKSRNATIGSHTAVVAGDVLGALTFAGSDGAAFVTGASIQAYAEGGSPGDTPARLVFYTCPGGAGGALSERLRISSGGTFTVWDGAIFVFGTISGAKFGSSVNQKLGFFNAAPIVQPSGANQAAVGTTAPAGGVGTAAGGWDTAANRNTAITTINSLVTLVNQMRSDLVALGFLKGSA